VAEPILDDIEECKPVLRIEGHEPEVIKDEQRGPSGSAYLKLLEALPDAQGETSGTAGASSSLHLWL